MTNQTDIVTTLALVIKNLQSRKDYKSVAFEELPSKKSISCADAVTQYKTLSLALETEKAKGTEVPVAELDAALALTAAIIHSNLLMQKMGQLSTSRTIEPSVATAHNETLTSLEKALSALKTSDNGDAGDDETPPHSLPHGPYEDSDCPDIDEQYP